MNSRAKADPNRHPVSDEYYSSMKSIYNMQIFVNPDIQIDRCSSLFVHLLSFARLRQLSHSTVPVTRLPLATP